MSEDQTKLLADTFRIIALFYTFLGAQVESQTVNPISKTSEKEPKCKDEVHIGNTSRRDEKILSYHGHSCTLRAVYANPCTFFPSTPELWAGKDSFSGLVIADKTLEDAAKQFKNAVITAETAEKFTNETSKTEKVENQVAPCGRRLSISMYFDPERYFVFYRRHCCELTKRLFDYGNRERWQCYDKKSSEFIIGDSLIDVATKFKFIVGKYEDERTCSKT